MPTSYTMVHNNKNTTQDLEASYKTTVRYSRGLHNTEIYANVNGIVAFSTGLLPCQQRSEVGPDLQQSLLQLCQVTYGFFYKCSLIVI